MNCKKLLWRALLALLIFLPLISCEKTEDGSYTAPITNYEKIMGKWSLSTLKQYDEIALANSSKPSELKLETKFSFNTFKITFNVDSTNEIVPTSYLVEGTAPELFPKEGFWDLDFPFKRADNIVTKIRLFSDAAKTVQTDELVLVSTPGAKAVLELKLVRYSKGTPYASYLYSLKPSK